MYRTKEGREPLRELDREQLSFTLKPGDTRILNQLRGQSAAAEPEEGCRFAPITLKNIVVQFKSSIKARRPTHVVELCVRH